MTVLVKANSDLNDRKLTTEVRDWQLKVRPAREFETAENTGRSQRSDNGFGVRWSPPRKDVNMQLGERPPLEAANKQHD
jgi:hypothetical protein